MATSSTTRKTIVIQKHMDASRRRGNGTCHGRSGTGRHGRSAASGSSAIDVPVSQPAFRSDHGNRAALAAVDPISGSLLLTFSFEAGRNADMTVLNAASSAAATGGEREGTVDRNKRLRARPATIALFPISGQARA